MLREYLEKYSGNEYIYQFSGMKNNNYTLVFRIMGKSELFKSRRPKSFGKSYYSNCELVDIINNKDISKKVESITISFSNEFDGKLKKYVVGDIIEDGYYVGGHTKIDEYLGEWFS